MNNVVRRSLSVALALAIAWPSTSRCNEITYIYTDMQLAPIMEADASGNVIRRFDYTPFGMETTGASAEGVGYAGHMMDRDANLIYMQARYYDPEVGRFLSIDPAANLEGGLFAPNYYAYANQNPYSYRDPDGRIVHLLAGAVISAGIDIAFQTAVSRGEEINWKSVAVSAGAGLVSGGWGSALKVRALHRAWSAERYAAAAGGVNAGIGLAQSVATDAVSGGRPDLTKALGTAVLAGAVGASLARAVNSGTIEAQTMARQAVDSPNGISRHVLNVTITSGRKPHEISSTPVFTEKAYEGAVIGIQEIDKSINN